jgi:putative addiction module component (TIGR02574 family)
MSTVLELEKEILALTPSERERLATLVWESLADDPHGLSDRTIDPDGLELAALRDREIESGHVQPISHDEFMRRTGR